LLIELKKVNLKKKLKSCKPVYLLYKFLYDLVSLNRLSQNKKTTTKI